MAVYAGIYLAAYVFLGLRVADAIGDAEALGVEPAHLPELLRGAPDGAEALRALAKVGFMEGDAHGDDLLVAAAQAAGARCPGNRFDDELDGLQAPSAGAVVG